MQMKLRFVILFTFIANVLGQLSDDSNRKSFKMERPRKKPATRAGETLGSNSKSRRPTNPKKIGIFERKDNFFLSDVMSQTLNCYLSMCKPSNFVTGLQLVSPNQMSAVMRYHRECQAKTGISNSVATGVIAGRFPNDPVLGNHLLCIHQGLGFQDANGNLQNDVISSTLQSVLPPSANVQQMVDSCAVQKSDPGQTALDMDRCFYGMVRGDQV